jgi:membrane protein YqaA with SNARE-associated domain
VADILTDILNFLLGAYSNPLVFLPLVFLYAIAIAVVLPIPIELSLVAPIVSQQWEYLLWISLALAAGKTVGAWLIFLLGVRVEDSIRWWSGKWNVAKWFVDKTELFVQKTGYLGLYILLSIPLMSDTIPIYLYSLFNKEGRTLERNIFLASNFLAAINRVAILGVLYVVGVNLLFAA